jgi:hypothetical protein
VLGSAITRIFADARPDAEQSSEPVPKSGAANARAERLCDELLFTLPLIGQASAALIQSNQNERISSS